MSSTSGLHICPISRLRIIFPVNPTVQQKGDKAYRAIANGSFVAGNTPVSPVMVGGSLLSPGCDIQKTAHRGGVAVLSNGEVVIGRLKFTSKPSGGTNLAPPSRQSHG